MGYTPREIEDMSLWQFNAVVSAHVSQNNPSGLTETEADELWDWLQSKEDGPSQALH